MSKGRFRGGFGKSGWNAPRRPAQTEYSESPGRRSSGQPSDDFDWRQFEKLFDELFPNVIPGLKGGTLSRIGQLVQNFVGQAASVGRSVGAPEARTGRSGLFDPVVRETDRLVKIRIPIPESVDPRKLQLFVSGQTLRIEGPLGNRQTVELPSPVSAKSGTAVFRDGVLYVRLRKRSGRGDREVYIQFP